MKMPRRRPRAVYEVYDADLALGEHDEELAGIAAEPAEVGVQPAGVAGEPAHMAAELATEPLHAARAPMSPVSPMPPVPPVPPVPPASFMPPVPPPGAARPRSTGRAFGRALTGAMLCVVAVCVIAAISIVLLHLLSGPSAAGPRTAQLGSRRSRTGPQGLRTSSPAVRRRSVDELAARSATSPRPGSRPRAAVAPRRAPGRRVHPGQRRVRAGQQRVRAGQPPLGAAAEGQRAAAEGQRAAAEGQRAAAADLHQTVLPAQANGLQREEAAVVSPPAGLPATVSACACAPAEVEFGFER
jgi:hypothetical protein